MTLLNLLLLLICRVNRGWSMDRDGPDASRAPPPAQWNNNNSQQMRRNNSESHNDNWPGITAPPFSNPTQQQFIGYSQPRPEVPYDASRMAPRFNNVPFNAMQAPNRGMSDFGNNRGGNSARSGSSSGGRWDNLDDSSRGGQGQSRGSQPQQQQQTQRWDRKSGGGDYGGGRGGHWNQGDSGLTAEDWARLQPRNDRIEL